MTVKINCLFLNCEQSHYYEVNFLDLIFPVFNSILLLPYGGSNGKASVYNMRDLGLIPGLRRFPGEGNGNPLQYSCLENPIDGGASCRLLSMGSQRVGHNWATSLISGHKWCILRRIITWNCENTDSIWVLSSISPD